MTPIGIQLKLGGEREVETGLRRVGGAMDTVGTAASALARAVGGVAGAFAGALSVREFVQAADAVTGLQNQLKLATGSAQAAGVAYNQLYEISQRSRTGFIELGKTFASISTAAADMGVSQQRLLKVTEAIGNAVTISGTGAQAAQAALQQLGQGLASGTLRGEELNSVMEQTPRLAKALADGLGVTRGELRALGQQGAITAEQVIKALESQSSVLQGEVKDATLTVGQAFTQLTNSATRAVGDFDKATGATATLAGTISSLAGAVDTLGGVIRNNEGAFKVLGGTLAGAAVVAGAAGIVKSIGLIGGAVAALGAVLLANPAVLALLGLSAAVGGGVALISAQSKTADGIGQAIERLRTENERSEAALARAVAGGRLAGADNIAKTIDARKDQIAKLRAELDSLQPASAGAGGGRGSVNPQTVGAAAAQQAAGEKELIAIRQKLYGVDKDYLPTLDKLHAQYTSGAISIDEYQKLVGKLAEANFKKEKADPGRGLKSEESAYQNLIATINTKIAQEREELAGAGALTESQRIRIKLDQDLAAGRVKLSAQNERAVRLALEELSASEASALAAKTLAKANLDAAASREKYLTSLSTGLDKIQADIAAQIEATERMGLSKEAIAELDAAKLEMLATDLELQAIKAMDRNLDQQTYDALKKQAAAYRELGIAKKGGAAKEAALELEKANAEAAKKAQEDWERASEQINSTLTDALMRGFESGKDFAKNLRDTVVNMFKTMVLRPVISAVLSPISGALGGVLGGGAGGAGSNPLGMASNAFSLYRGGSQAWTLGSQYFNGTMSGANVLGTGYANMTGAGLDGLLATNGAYGTAPTSGLTSGLGAVGTAFGVVAALAAAFGAFAKTKPVGAGLQGTLGEGVISDYILMRTGGSLFSGPDYDVLNKYRQLPELQRQREAAGDTQAGWLIQAQIDDLLKNHAGSLEETIKTSDALQKVYSDMRENTAKMADALGLSGDAIRNFTRAIGTEGLGDTGETGLQFNGLKPEEIQAKIAEALATANNEMAEQLIGSWKTVTDTVTTTVRSGMWDTGINYDTETETSTRDVYVASEFAKTGEKAIDTLTRLATSLSTVNDIWKNLGNTVYEASLAGADAASTMADAFGGLEAMAAATGAYFENFYSAEERRAAVERQLNEALGKLNLTLPDVDATDARAQYRALAEAQDRSTEEGRAAYVTLLQLSGAFASITDAAADATRALEAQRSAAYSDFRRAVDRDRSALQDQASALRDSIGAIADAVDMLRGNASELYNTVSTTAQMQAAQGMVYVENALAGVLAGGSVTDYTGLTDAIAAARGGIDSGVYATQFDRERDALVLAGQLSTLADVSDLQLSVEERQLRAINEQLEYLEGLDRRASDLVNGTTALTETVQTYFDRLMGILEPEKPEGTPGKPGGSGAGSGAGGGAVFGPGGGGGSAPASPYRRPMALGTAGTGYSPVTDAAEVNKLNDLASVYHSFDGTGDLTGLLTAIRDAGGTISDLEALSGYYQSDWRKAAESVGIPAFAVGTNYVPRDMVARIHEGEAIVPKAYNPWANGQSMQGGDPELLAEMRAMRAELAALRAASAATANNTAGLPQMADQFDTVTNGGNAMRAKALA